MIFRVTMFKYVIFIIKDMFEVIQLVSAGGLKREKKGKESSPKWKFSQYSATYHFEAVEHRKKSLAECSCCSFPFIKSEYRIQYK